MAVFVKMKTTGLGIWFLIDFDLPVKPEVLVKPIELIFILANNAVTVDKTYTTYTRSGINYTHRALLDTEINPKFLIP